MSTIFNTTGPYDDYYIDRTLNIILGVCLLIMAVIGIVGNILVILAVMFSRQLQTAMNVFVVNLSIADLLASLTYTTQAASVFEWVELSPVMCILTTVVNITSLGCSLITVTLIAINRYIIITKMRHTYDRIYTRVKMGIMIVMAWLVGPICMILASAQICGQYLVKHGAGGLSWLVPFLLVTTLVIVLVCYILIFKHIKRHVAKSMVKRSSSKRLDISITKNLLCVVCAFYLCVVPYTLALVLAKFSPSRAVYHSIVTVFTVVLNINSVVNPIIYAARHPVFKPIFYQMVTCRLHQIREPSRFLKSLVSTTTAYHMEKSVTLSTSGGKTCESDVV